MAPIFSIFRARFSPEFAWHFCCVADWADLRNWLPGDAVFEDPLFVPQDLAAGNYEFSVAMLDPLTLQPGIRLGIEGRASDGW